MATRAAVSSVTINKLLGYVTYLLDDASSKIIEAPAIDSTRPDGWQTETPSHTLLELPAEIAAHGFDCYDLTILHLPSIERGYLAEVRTAFEESGVEIFQLLIDTGEVGSPDPDERSAGIKHTKLWIEVARELGASGVRYVPGDSEPTPETMRECATAFREIFDFAVESGLKPATENYRIFTNEADDLLRLVEALASETMDGSPILATPKVLKSMITWPSCCRARPRSMPGRCPTKMAGLTKTSFVVA